MTRLTRRLELRGMGEWEIAGIRGALAMPRWAPDSWEFAFQVIRMGSGTPAEPVLAYAVMLANADTGETKRIGTEVPEAERASDLCWRPDGKAVTCVSGARSLTTLSLEGGRVSWKDSDLPGPRHLRLGNYSSDGAWLLITSDSADPNGRGNRDVWVSPHFGGATKRLTQGSGTHVYPTSGPDGENVYFVHGKPGPPIDTWGIWRVRVDRKTMLPEGAPAETFVRLGSKFLHPKFVANGRKLTYAVEEPNTDIWVSEANTIEKGVIVLRGQSPVLSPDGQTIYFVGERPHQQGVFSINRNCNAASLRKVTDLTPLAKGLTRGGLSLSPDGEMLALFSDDGKRQGVFVVPTSGGQPKLVEELSATNKALPVWSPHGNWLAYAFDKQLIRLSRDGRVREPLAQLHSWEGCSTRWSPDGKHLAAFGYEKREDLENDTNHFAWVVSVAGKQPRKLTPDTERRYTEGLEWHPSGEYVTYYQDCGIGYE